MEYTIQQLARIAGISVRTLHYYDEVGILTPSKKRGNGYRVYYRKDLEILQQILFFRALEFPLSVIKTILQSPNFSIKEALENQRQLFLLRKEHIEKLLHTINKTILQELLTLLTN